MRNMGRGSLLRSAQPPDTELSSAICRFCGSAMRSDARYCSDCGHWQSWWGPCVQMFKPSDILVAGTLLAFFWGVARPLLWGTYAAVEIIVLSTDASQVRAVLSNTGGRDALVFGAQFGLEGQNSDLFPGQIRTDGGEEDFVLLRADGPGKIVVFTLTTVNASKLKRANSAGNECRFEISLSATGHRDGAPSPKIGQIECDGVF